MEKITLLLILCLLVCFSKAEESPIKLHVFLHSHLDEGWIYTFEQYYQGTGTDDGGSVKSVFNNVYESLGRSAERKYQIAEVGFVNRWWSEQDEGRRAIFKTYVDQKQIQFVNGGWSANDEACAYYEDIIDQFILGNRWLKSNFGVYPSVGWQIDSFGHSETQAAIMAQAGYDGFFYGRLDHQDWETRRAQKTLEVVWKPQNPHNESIFGHALYFHYSDTKFMVYDNFYCRSIFCNGNLQDYELEKVTNWVKMQGDAFETKNVAMLVGDDFHMWRESEKDFVGIEAMIDHYKNHPEIGIQAKFSTLNDYLAEFKEDLKASQKQYSLPEKHGDFFPYIENSWTSWVGYFTSKSMFKFKVRRTSEYYNAAKLLLAKFMLGSTPGVFTFDKQTHSTLDKALNDLEEPLAVVQHHDAVSGTMKDNVRYDYESMLQKGWSSVHQQVVELLNKNIKQLIGEDNYNYGSIEFDWQENDPNLQSIFDLQRNVLVTAFNPGEKDKFLIKIKIPTYQYKIADELNNYLTIDIICHSNSGKEDCFAYFVDEIPAYSLKNYIISPAKLSKRVVPKDIQDNLKININNQVTLDIDKNLKDFTYKLCTKLDTNNLESLFSERKCIEDSFNLNYEYYESYVGSGLQVSSGAYVFRPNSDIKQTYSEVVSGRVFQGRVVTIVQIRRDSVRTDLKFVHHELQRGIEIESYLEPVESAQNGKEIVIMLRSKNVLNTDKVFYTDNNGYYMAKRQLDHRNDFNTYNPDIHIPSNYYPITSAFYIETPNKQKRMTVLTDRAQGATSLNPGEIEIMIHRVTVSDDWKGLGETLQEMEPGTDRHIRVSTRHCLMFSSPDTEFESYQRRKQYKLDRPLQFWFRNIDTIEFANSNPSTAQTLDLPENVKLSIRSYDAYEYIVRLQNLDEKNSKKITLFTPEDKKCDILNNFAGRNDIQIASVTELSLFTTRNKKDVKLNELDPLLTATTPNDDSQDLSTIEILPMEIRTFSILLNFL